MPCGTSRTANSRQDVPQVSTADFNSFKKAEKTRIPPTTANYRHFLGWISVKKPTILMAILPTGFWWKVLVADRYRN